MTAYMRPRAREYDGLRDISVVYEHLDRVDGSARFGFGETKALASISGPIEVRPTLENPSQATLDIQIRPLPGIPGTDSKALATTLKAIFSPSLFLSRHPRTLIQVVGQALCGSESGSGSGSAGRGWNASLVASLVNAVAAAFLNANSVPMKGVVCAVAVGRLGPGAGGAPILDPEETELANLAGSGCFAFLFSSPLSAGFGSDEPSIPACSLLWTSYTTATPFDVEELGRAREVAQEGARQVWLALKDSVRSQTAETVVKMGTEASIKGEPLSQSVSMEVDDDKVEIQ